MLKGHWQANALDTAPDLSALKSVGYPTNGDPTRGVPATQPGAAWFHLMDQMRLSVIEAAGETEDTPTNPNLFYESLLKVIIKGITNGSILTAMLADGAVTTPKIADAAVQTSKIQDAAVTLAKLAAGSVNASKIVSGSITNTQLAANTIAFDRLASAAIATLEQALAGTAKNVLMTPYAVAQAIAAQIPPSIPSGFILPFAGTSIPEGWLICNGAAVSRTEYAALFSAIGTKWGEGDGSTTFNLPDLDERFIEGTVDTSKVGQYVEAGLPDISGEFSENCASCVPEDDAYASGVFEIHRLGTVGFVVSQTQLQYDQARIKLSPSRESAVFGGSSTVQPPSARVLSCIKT